MGNVIAIVGMNALLHMRNGFTAFIVIQITDFLFGCELNLYI